MTIVVEHHCNIDATPEAVWRSLTDFPHWADWHPHRALLGEAKLHARVVHILRQPSAGRRRTPSTIDVLEEGRCLSFRFGRRWYGYSFERFCLEPRKSGTRLIQVTQTPLWMVKLQRGPNVHEAAVRNACEQVALALCRRLKPGRGQPRGRLSHRGRL
jgi:hypothetical protein